MNPQELEELWNEVKKDAKERPESYFKPHLTFWNIRVKDKLKRLMEGVVILNKRKIKRPQMSNLMKCDNCEGNGWFIVASACLLLKNGGVYSKVKKESTFCHECYGKGYLGNI